MTGDYNIESAQRRFSIFHIPLLLPCLLSSGILDTDREQYCRAWKTSCQPNPAIGGASQHNSMSVPSPDKWGSRPTNPA